MKTTAVAVLVVALLAVAAGSAAAAGEPDRSVFAASSERSVAVVGDSCQQLSHCTWIFG